MRLIPASALSLLAGMILSGPALAATAGTATQCPTTDFVAFLEQFSADIAVQESATAEPLLMHRLDPAAEPEPRPYSETVALADVLWPVIPNLVIARRYGKEVVVSGNGDQRQVTVREPDNGNQVRYVFGRQPCWTLLAVHDEAL
jgi:hypothetical protein